MGIVIKFILYGAAIATALFALDEMRARPWSLAGDERHTNRWFFWAVVCSELLLSALLSTAATFL